MAQLLFLQSTESTKESLTLFPSLWAFGQAFYVSPQLEPIVPVGGPMLLPRQLSFSNLRVDLCL